MKKNGSKPEPKNTKAGEATKPDAKASKPEAKPETKKAKESKKEEGRYNRAQSIADAMRAGAKSKEDILAKADALYVKHGGTSNARETLWAFSHCRACLLAFGFVTEDNGKLSLKG